MKTILELLGNPEELQPRSGINLTPLQRVALMERMQARFWELLKERPDIYAEILRRHYKKRAIDPDAVEERWHEPE